MTVLPLTPSRSISLDTATTSMSKETNASKESLSQASTQSTNNAEQSIYRTVQDVIFTTQNISDSRFFATIVYIDPGYDKPIPFQIGDTAQFMIVSSNASGEDIFTAEVVDASSSRSIIKTTFGVIESDNATFSDGSKITFSTATSRHVNSEHSAVRYPTSTLVSITNLIKANLPAIDALLGSLTINNTSEPYLRLARIVAQSTRKISAAKTLTNSKAVSAEQLEDWMQAISSQDSIEANILHLASKYLDEQREYDKSQKDKAHNAEMHYKEIEIAAPIFTGEEIIPCKILIKTPQDNHSNRRFAIEVYPGEMRITGLMHFTQGHSGINHMNHLDIIIETKNNIKEEIKDALSRIFMSHQRINGVKGSIRFAELDPKDIDDTTAVTPSSISILS